MSPHRLSSARARKDAQARRALGIVLSFLGCGSLALGCMPQPAQPPTPGPEQACVARANAERTRRSAEPERIGLRHILVRHGESKNVDPSVTRSRGQACLRALRAREELEAGKDWNAVVATYSDERRATERHGSLGVLRRRDLDPSFADAAFELEVGELSDAVETPFGFHVIQRTE